MPIDRRTFLFGVPLAGFGVAATGVLVYRSWDANRSAVEVGGDYEEYLAEVADDYRAGKVGVIDGWILSETEIRTYRDMIRD